MYVENLKFSQPVSYTYSVSLLRVVCCYILKSVMSYSVVVIFSARCNIYISRLCYEVSGRLLSVRLWRVCIVVTGCNRSRISLHAWIDGCLCYFTDNASPGSSDGMMPGFLVEEGMGMEKLEIVTISLNLLIKSLDRKRFCLHMNVVNIYLIL